ncbi:glycerophosphodiester phosphodiesterase [Clostridium botulinum]|uniref:glycerophosphodiester phosphodiesterase n=1 Tax=Clostridium botulinum TaxID=1491 RepID=A0A0M1M3F8_CLOBO|nr:glycerophosphodiester phosphodiesterase [Clostridium botulinum]KAI3345903.1 glycerophosphodiester phosphodiesterase [Clostridium botulinum]KOM89223.1 glycerophosphodiester phosphodiesterase [Clostridium botulinum]KOR64200.1 glycerophosphodiester phosphodiesterase [Clostridium botulinum]MBN1075886.1 glycerophosphodiester phosphodiesterase [Clostridium botulinum]MCS6112028.1 glycerophosphodiester phosphodiesterase [Clostridium botulinum]
MKKTRKLVALATALVLSVGLVVCGQVSCNAATISASREANQSVTKSDKIIIAHRGASGYLPEHTLEAYSLAYAMGVDYIEADVNITKDGVPVVMHDTHLDTTTNVATLYPNRKRADGRYYIVDFTLKEIKNLTVHERIDLDTGNAVFKDRFPLGSSHFEVPTLEEEIQLIQGLNKSTGRNVGIYPELKFPKFYKENGHDIGAITLKMLDKYGYNQKDAKCYIQCFDPTYLKSFKETLNPKCKLVQLIGHSDWEDNEGDDVPYMLSAKGLKEIAKFADGVGPCTDQILDENGNQKKSALVANANFVKDSHANNLEIHPYTVRKDDLPKYAKDADQFIRKLLFEVNVDGLFTDFADIGVKAKSEGPIK